MKRIGIVVGSLLIAGIALFVILFWNELRSLASIEKLDDYGMFQMTYYGDYGFDEFLTTGASSDSEIEAFVTKRLLKGLPIDLGITGGGCTVFVTRDDTGDVIMGRNFDFSYSPSVQLVTRPTNGGYASVSTVNLAFLGYSEDNLPGGIDLNSFATLVGPFLPFDGMNEKGLSVAIVAVPEADPPFDANGDSVLVEYYDGGLQTVKTEEPYQIASNFIAYNNVNIGEGFNEFERYDTVKAAIEENDGVLSKTQAVDLLAEVGIVSKGEDKLEWSVVYNLTDLTGTIFAARNTENQVEFQLAPGNLY